jgi:hypothetical protein
MLIKVFGIWLMASNINHLEPSLLASENCIIRMNELGSSRGAIATNKTCDEVAEEINKQIKG